MLPFVELLLGLWLVVIVEFWDIVVKSLGQQPSLLLCQLAYRAVTWPQFRRLYCPDARPFMAASGFGALARAVVTFIPANLNHSHLHHDVSITLALTSQITSC